MLHHSKETPQTQIECECVYFALLMFHLHILEADSTIRFFACLVLDAFCNLTLSAISQCVCVPYED